MKSSWKQALAAAAVSVLAAACGGGGDGGGDSATPLPSAAAANKYVGTWVMACTPSGLNSDGESITFRQASDNELTLTWNFQTFTGNTNCTGTPVNDTVTGTVTLDGQTTATHQGQARTFDRMTATVDNPSVTLKWIGTILPDGAMMIDFKDNGAESSTVYPTNPDEGETVYTKQQVHA